MAANWHIAQLNIAKALYPHEDPRMSEFFDRLDEINGLAESSPGFVWRLEDESGNATDIRVENDPTLIVNISVWQSVESLFDFTYKSAHTSVLANRRKWFDRAEGAYQVLWWVTADHRPSLAEGMERLRLLQRSGPSPQAFTFKSTFPSPDAA